MCPCAQGTKKQGPSLLAAGLGALGLGLMALVPPQNPHSPLSGMWRTMFPATPSSSTWHGRRGYPVLASRGSRRRNRRHMTGGTGRGVGMARGTSCSPRAWSRTVAAEPEGAGARAGGVEGSRNRSRKRWQPGRRRTGSIFLPGGVQESQRGPLRPGPVGWWPQVRGGFAVLEGACPNPTVLEGRSGRRSQGGWSRVNLEGRAAGGRGSLEKNLILHFRVGPASWEQGLASKGGASSPSLGADLQALGGVSRGGVSLPGRMGGSPGWQN